MVKEKRILSYFVGWLILGLFICFIGISKTHALVIDSSFLGYSNNNNFGISAGNYVSGNSFITVDQSNALNYYVVDICTTLNNLFTITNITNQSGNVSLYKTYSYLGSCRTDNYSGQLSRIYFKINEWADAGNGNFGVIFSARLNSTASYYGDNKIINIYTTNEIDNTSEIINNQTNELNNSINNSTNTINGSIGNAENNINQNIDDMESAIVDSNKETQDVIKDQFNSCRESKNLFPGWTIGQYYNSSTGVLSTSNAMSSSSDYIRVDFNKNSNYYLSNLSTVANTYISAYDINKNYIGRTSSNAVSYINFYPERITSYGSGSGDINNIAYITVSFGSTEIPKNTMLNTGSLALDYEPYGEKVCTNKLDEQNEALNNIGDALTDSSSPNTGALENSAGWLPAGPLDSVLNLPLSLFNALTTNLNKSCNPINIPLPFVNKNIILPCINTLYNQIGIASFLSWIGVIVSGLMLYTYLLKLYKWIEDRISLNETHNLDSWGGL